MGLHDGHRKRVKDKFSQHGLDCFADHEVLEILLMYALPRVDVNPIAHHLLERFNSLAGVFSATETDLAAIEGMGEHSARLISLIPQVCRRYEISRDCTDNILSTTDAVGTFLMPRFFGLRDEVVYVVCLDAKLQVIGCRELARGDVNSTRISPRKVVEYALSANASCVVMAHNHPSGVALPSSDDKLVTRKVFQALDAVDIQLIDHIIVADGDFVSMADSGFFRIMID